MREQSEVQMPFIWIQLSSDFLLPQNYQKNGLLFKVSSCPAPKPEYLWQLQLCLTTSSKLSDLDWLFNGTHLLLWDGIACEHFCKVPKTYLHLSIERPCNVSLPCRNQVLATVRGLDLAAERLWQTVTTPVFCVFFRSLKGQHVMEIKRSHWVKFLFSSNFCCMIPRHPFETFADFMKLENRWLPPQAGSRFRNLKGDGTTQGFQVCKFQSFLYTGQIPKLWPDSGRSLIWVSKILATWHLPPQECDSHATSSFCVAFGSSGFFWRSTFPALKHHQPCTPLQSASQLQLNIGAFGKLQKLLVYVLESRLMSMDGATQIPISEFEASRWHDSRVCVWYSQVCKFQSCLLAKYLISVNSCSYSHINWGKTDPLLCFSTWATLKIRHCTSISIIY